MTIPKSWQEITLEQFIELSEVEEESFLLSNIEIISIVADCDIEEVNDWGIEEFEPYKYSLDERASVFLELPVTSVFGAYSEYMKFRADVMKSYENLFQANIEEVEDLDPEDAKEEEEEKRFNKWSWERLIYDLANEDITKADHVTDLPLILVFNFLSMRYELKL
jgi:hypothetical protein